MSYGKVRKRPARLHIESLEGRALLAAAVQSFTLIDADTYRPVAEFLTLTDGAVLDLANLPTRNLNIRANTTAAAVGSVKFQYDGVAYTKVESVAPYALAGDDQGDYRAWTPMVGTHTLTATPYPWAGADGEAETPLTIRFTVRDSGGPATPPAAPTGLAAGAVSPAQLDLAWADNSSDETGFVIERRDGASGTFSPLATVAADITRYSDTNVAPGNTYTYRVMATNAAGTSEYGATAAATTPSAGVLFSDGFDAAGMGVAWSITGGDWQQSGGVLSQTGLGWADPKKASVAGVAFPTDVEVRARVRVDAWAGGDYARAGVSLGSDDIGRGYNLLFHRDTNTVQFLNDHVVWGNSYAFSWQVGSWYHFAMRQEGGGLYGKVWADGESEPSGWMFRQEGWEPRAGSPGLNGGSYAGSTASFDDFAVAAVSPRIPSAPTGLTASADGPGRIVLSWDDSPGVDSTRIERSPDGLTGWAQVGTAMAGATTWIDSGLSDATTYHYRVRANNATGPSPYSNAVTVATSTVPDPDSVPVAPDPGDLPVAPDPGDVPGVLPPAIAGEGYHLAFSDEFAGSSIDTRKWHLGGPWGESDSVQTGALSSYTPANVSASEGAAHLVVDTDGQGDWKSSILNTDTTFTFVYGYVEVRAQVPSGQGLWPAIWLYNVENRADEIDIMEFLGGDPGRIYQTNHYPGGSRQFSSYTNDWSAAYHTYGVKWSPNAIVFYIDDRETGRITSNISGREMYLMINNDAGGDQSWGGSVDASTPNPNRMSVDYVRIYQT